MAARPPRFLFVCAKRQPATPIRKLRLSFSSGLSPNNAKPSPAISQFGCYPWTKVKTGSTQRSAALLDQFEFSRWAPAGVVVLCPHDRWPPFHWGTLTILDA
jgi:hypothetical protein